MDDGLVTIKTIAKDWLRKSERGVWKDISTGVFGPDVLRLGRSVRVRAGELRAWIAAGCPRREVWIRTRGGVA